jgi:Cys-tRNA(Pro)/Cys-tRNA(Cys) deacylase
MFRNPGSAAAFTAINDPIPVPLPFLAPHKGTLTDRAQFARKVFFGNSSHPLLDFRFVRMMEKVKTNAARILEELGIAYQLREYDVDSDHLDAETVALKVGLPPEQVFKTLVVRGDRQGICMAVVPADSELDLKALAKLSGNRKMEMVPLKEVQPLTGYIRGGVTALALKKPYPVFADETMILYDEIAVSAGVRGTQILLRPEDYIRAVSAATGEIAKAQSG